MTAIKDTTSAELTGSEPTREIPSFTPRFDILETADELTLYGDFPGVRQDQLDIRYEDEQLTIQGKVDDRSAGKRYLRHEYDIGDFYRSFRIGETIDAAKIHAEVHNGVLIVHLPKIAAVQPRRIQVNAV